MSNDAWDDSSENDRCHHGVAFDDECEDCEIEDEMDGEENEVQCECRYCHCFVRGSTGPNGQCDDCHNGIHQG